MLFDIDIARTCTDEKRGMKSHFDFINNSSLEEHHKIRMLLNKCFEEYNQLAQNEIRIRLSENYDESFYSTSFELLVAHLFRTLGCSLEEHPNVEGTDKHPDFLVTLRSGESFFLELVTVGEYDDWSVEEFRRFIASFRDDNYINIRTTNGRDLHHNEYIKLRKDIKAWWHTHKKIAGSETTWVSSDGSFKTELEILHQSAVGISSTIVPVHFHTKLLDSLKKKANRYGEFDRPYIIATTFRPSTFSAGLQFMQDLLVQSLYGEGLTLNHKTKRYEGASSLWDTHRTKPKYKNVSGILFFDELTPYRALEPFKYCLFLNDDANHPLLDCFKEVFSFYYEKDDLTYKREGGSIAQRFRKSLEE